MSTVIASPATCFGKIPSRGDFVKGAGQHQLISVLDRWVSQTMELLSEDPAWKTAYDGACPVDFAFIGARSRLSVVGHLGRGHVGRGASAHGGQACGLCGRCLCAPFAQLHRAAGVSPLL